MGILEAYLIPHHLGDDRQLCKDIAVYVANVLGLARPGNVTVGHLLQVVKAEGGPREFASRHTLHISYQDIEEIDALDAAIRKLFARAERQQSAEHYDGGAPTWTRMGDTYVGDGVERKPFHPN